MFLQGDPCCFHLVSFMGGDKPEPGLVSTPEGTSTETSLSIKYFVTSTTLEIISFGIILSRICNRFQKDCHKYS